MTEIIQLIEQVGVAASDFFWLPVAIWTVSALLIAIFLNYRQNISAVYQYHFRVAVVAVLPIGILIAALIQSWLTAAQSAYVAPLFVIQNPIAVSQGANAAQTGITIAPAFWVGIATFLTMLIAVAALIKLGYHFIQLKLFISEVEAENYSAQEVDNEVTVLFSNRVEIPCTCGWFHKVVVLPVALKNDPEKFKMALCHELTHIRNRDYFINSFLEVTKALFCFHPLVHQLTKQTDEFREIYCDINVLTDPEISQKKYAELLFELAPKKLYKNTAAVNMAVNPSTLKKRIQMMKKTKVLPSAKRSILATLTLALTLVGFMACSDVTDNGLTVGEVKEVQKKAANSTVTLDGDIRPLFVLNGEVLSPSNRILERIKPKYIEAITVLKGQKAIEAYGDKGKNGVIEIKVTAKEKALKDLQSPNSKKTASLSVGDNVFVAVQDMPQLKTSRAELQSKVAYPESCSEAGIEGTVIVQFVVQPSGDMNNFEVIRGIGGGCDQAAVEAIKQYAEFTPGEQGGKKVPVRMSFPIVFKMQ